MDIQKVMRRTLAVAFVASLGTLAARVDIHSAPLREGVRCQRCDRVLDNSRVAGEIVANQYVAHPFRTIRCMLTYLQETDVPAGRIYVADYVTGRTVPVAQAHFVPVPIGVLSKNAAYGVGDYDYVAFRSRSAANRFAERHGTSPRGWESVRDAAIPVSSMAHASH
jgi:nitrous oxide reductase accessory protein NosL